MCEAWRRVKAALKTEKKDKAQKEKEKESRSEWDAFRLYDDWKRAGKPMADGKPKFASIKNAIVVLKVLLPKVAPTKKITTYNSGKKALESLVAITGGMTWEDENDHLSVQKEAKYEQAHGTASTENTGRLF